MASKSGVLMPAQWELASQIRALRDAASVSASELGTRISRSQSHIARWETASTAPNETDVYAVCDALGVGPERQARLLTLVSRAQRDGGRGPMANRSLDQLMAFEDAAISIVKTAPMLIPGMLQTPDYIRALMRSWDLSGSEVDRRVDMRTRRQKTIFDNGTRLEVLMADRVFDVGPCEPHVLHEQLKHLLDLLDNDAITIRMVPMGPHALAMFDGSYAIMRFSAMQPVAQFEVYDYAHLVTDPKAIGAFERYASQSRQNAYTPEDTHAMLRRMVGK